MFNSLSHKCQADQNNAEIPSHPSKNGYHQENKQMMARIQGKVNFILYTIGWNVN
jgi:heme O synthase-like polyprenyltransferase